MSAAPLGCPFCGSPACTGYRPPNNIFFVMCMAPTCHATIERPDLPSAIAAWNRRAPATEAERG